ncbi:MAG: glycosylase [Alistipes sp.]|nr:glycosylase [Alistipes sp.]
MKQITLFRGVGLWLGMMFSVGVGYGQNEVPTEVMERVYQEVRTPYKYGLVITASEQGGLVDSPTVFRVGKRWYMTYVRYDGESTSSEGTGYETWLAESDNLLEWKTLGRILSFHEGAWDAAQRGGYLSLCSYRWGEAPRPQKFQGNYWLSYIGGASQGYEAGQLNIGMAYTDRSPAEVHEWQSWETPVMTPKDSGVGEWENYTLYKSSVFKAPRRKLGAPFVMFYNAKGDGVWRECIGIATSEDLKHWRRYATQPVLEHPKGITGDAQIQRMGRLYVMFYFGAFWDQKPYRAFNRFACSYDLVHWTDWQGEELIYPSCSYDQQFAHKSFVLKYKGVVYHFYCAVNEQNQRGIAVATSRDLGASALHFDALP